MKTSKIIRFLIVVTLFNRLGYAATDTALDQELQYLQAEKAGWVEVVSKQKEDKNTAAGIVSIEIGRASCRERVSPSV
jgi:hypothetical protein